MTLTPIALPPAGRQVDGGRRPLRIAVVAPPWLGIPPGAYGGVEAVCDTLVHGLVELGHDVTIFGAGGSEGVPGARFVATIAEPCPDRIGDMGPALVHAAVVNRHVASGRYDVVHDHTLAGLATAALRPAPTVSTMHGPITEEICDLISAVDGVSLVAISDRQRADAPRQPWAGRVHNAVRVDQYPYRAHKDEFLLFLGRCCPDKGLDTAIAAARAARRHLVVAAKCREPGEQSYFEREIAPLLGPGVTWLGEVGGLAKLALLRQARCLLFPIRWEEPFGMVMIEAMACGTPVVALRRGAVPEVLRHGRTGLMTDDPDRLPDLVEQVGSLRPADCRADVEERFDARRMAEEYVAVYRAAIRRWPAVRTAAFTA